MEPFYHNLTFDDFDDFTASVTWDLELKQLSEGKFRADLIFLGDMDIQLGKTLYNVQLLQNGSVPDGITFAVHHPDSAPFTWRHIDFPANSIIVFPESREHQGLSQPNHHPFTVTVSETFLTAVCEDLGLPELDRFVLKGEVLSCDPKAIHEIQTYLVWLCAETGNINRELLDTLINHETKWKIARLLLTALTDSTGIKRRKRQFQQRKRVVDRVLEYVDADLSAQRSLSELCRVAEVDERTLRNCFYERFSLSPIKFINCHRLNVVRSALKKTDASIASITDIANHNGFWHMGQFAKDYKNLFGELPSKTVKK